MAPPPTFRKGARLPLLLLLLIAGGAGVAHAVSFQDLLNVTQSTAVSDPVLFKSWLAAQMSAAAATGTCPTGVACAYNASLVYGSTTAQLTSTDTYQLVVAFSSADPALNGSSGGNATMAPITYADLIVSGNEAAQPQAKTFDAFRTGTGLKKGQSITKAVSAWGLKTNKGKPVNVLITGIGAGATLAPLAALYLAPTYPDAHITVITFGMPTWPLNNVANWTLTQLTDLYYFYPASLDSYKSLQSATIDDITSMKDSFIKLPIFQKELAGDLLQLLQDSQVVQIFDNSGRDVTTLSLPTTPVNDSSNYILDTNKTADYGPERLNQTIDVWNSVKDECTPVFCKIRFPSVLQALIYEEYYPEYPDLHGPVRIDEVFTPYGPIQGMFNAGRDADGAVGWIPDTETAYFIFRGSESRRDWQADANALQAYYKTGSDAQAAVFLDPQAHAGVYHQFERLTFEPLKPEDDMLLTFKNISDGAYPRRVVCTGQSLGGGLSHMCGPWASNTFPNASVFVFNEGSLKPGDHHFHTFFNVLVGNAYRMVNGKDQVPLLSPTSNFEHVARGWWLDNSTTLGPKLVLGERDKLALSDSNWVDHSYYTYSLLQMTIDNLTAPDWVLQLNNASYFEQYTGAPAVHHLGPLNFVVAIATTLLMGMAIF